MKRPDLLTAAAGLVALVVLGSLVHFAVVDGLGFEADGQGARLARLWAYSVTGRGDFLLRWGEPYWDQPPILPASSVTPYPPLPALLAAPLLALLGPGVTAQRLLGCLPAALLLLGVADAGRAVAGRRGAVLALSLVGGSAVATTVLRQPNGEVWVTAASAFAAAALARLGTRTSSSLAAGVAVAVALLCKWTAVVLLLPASLALCGVAIAEVRRGARGVGTLIAATSVATLAAALFGLAMVGSAPRWLAAGLPPVLAAVGLVRARPLGTNLPVEVGRALLVAVALATPWYGYAAPAIAEHLVGHEVLMVGASSGIVRAYANLIVAVGIPVAGLFIGFGILGLAWPGRLPGAVAMATAFLALGGTLASGRVDGFLMGQAQDRLLLPVIAALAIAAARGAVVPRVGPVLTLAAAALALGTVAVSHAGAAARPVRSAGLGMACGEQIDLGSRGYRWWLPGVAVASPPDPGRGDPELEALAARLPSRAEPILAGLLLDDEPCSMTESRLVRLAETGRVLSLAPRGDTARHRAWIESRVERLDEFVGVGVRAASSVRSAGLSAGWALTVDDADLVVIARPRAGPAGND